MNRHARTRTCALAPAAALAVLVGLCAGGCSTPCRAPVRSTEGLPSHHRAPFQPELVGTWQQRYAEGQWTVRPDPRNATGYLVSHQASDGTTDSGLYALHIVMVGDRMFADLHPREPESLRGLEEAFWASHTLPAHSLALMEGHQDLYHAFPLNPRWLHRMLPRQSFGVHMVHLHADSCLLTTDPAALLSFLEHHATSARAFDRPLVFRKSPVTKEIESPP